MILGQNLWKIQCLFSSWSQIVVCKDAQCMVYDERFRWLVQIDPKGSIRETFFNENKNLKYEPKSVVIGSVEGFFCFYLNWNFCCGSPSALE